MTESNYDSQSSQSQAVGLPRDLFRHLWAQITLRLKGGEVLLRNEDFERAIEEMYVDATGANPSSDIKHEIRFTVETVNRDYPQTYLAQAMQNGVTKAFEECVRQLNWDLVRVQAKGARSLRRFSQQDAVRDLFEELNLRPGDIDPLGAVQSVVDEISGTREDVPQPEVPIPPAYSFDEPEEAAVAITPEPSPPVEVLDDDAMAAVDSGDIDADEARQRIDQEAKRKGEIEEKEHKKVSKNLDSYVKQGIVTEDEAEKIRELRAVDERVKKGEIDEKEAGEIRNSILKGSARDKLESKIRDVVADSVRYIQVFESMQRVDPKFHDAFGFLIQHKNLVTAADGAGLDLSPAVKTLMADVELIDLMVDIMERKDQEIRMMSVRLHPYSAIMGRGIERISNMTIEESFVDDLANLSGDDISERLNSSDQLTRVRPAADIRCMISLVEHVTKKTPFRKELRLLRIAKQLEDFFSSTTDIKEARRQAESFLNRRLRRIFPGMDSDEAAELKQASTAMMEQIEQRVLSERQEAVKGKEAVAATAATDASAKSGGDDDMELSEEELKKGVQIGRVQMRVAGATRRIPQKIMPDPEDPAQFVICQRDPTTGELAPAMRRGAKRKVERGRDGSWQEAK
jgi:hypothetical protein